jgi:hypothetical protein
MKGWMNTRKALSTLFAKNNIIDNDVECLNLEDKDIILPSIYSAKWDDDNY